MNSAQIESTGNLTLIKADGISVKRGTNEILQRVSLEVRSGQIVTLIGPNGAGKSTLVKALLGLIPLSEGRIDRHPNLRIGYVPQRMQIDQTLPMTANRFLRLAGVRSRAIKEALAQTGIENLGRHAVQELSGGEFQRLLLARAILRKPDLMVLDEPAQGVDITGQTDLYDLIGNIRDQLDCGVIMVSHDLHLVMSATDHVLCLNQHICCSGHPEQVSNDPAYRTLFGESAAGALAVYHHHHNHRHDAHGKIIPAGDDNHAQDHDHQEHDCHHG